MPSKQVVKKKPNNGFKPGNKFWNNRSRHGLEKLFKTPTILAEAAAEYFQWADKHPLIEEKPMVVSVGNNSGSEVQMVKVKHKRPYTLQALCLYLNCNTAYFRQFKARLKPDNPLDHDFATVIAVIEETIYNQKFEGAAVGFFNSNIISRDLGLAEKVELDQTARITVGNIFAPLDQLTDGKQSE